MSYTPDIGLSNIIKNLKFEPHKKINTSSTINWMRHLIPQQDINQSLTDLLIEKDLPNVLRLLESKKFISDHKLFNLIHLTRLSFLFFGFGQNI